MYGCATPCLVYGVIEDNSDQALKYNLLKKYGLEMYTTEMVRNHAYKIVYGLSVSLQQFKEGITYSEVDEFAKKIGFNTPDYYLVISGDYHLCHSRYNPEEDEEDEEEN